MFVSEAAAQASAADRTNFGVLHRFPIVLHRVKGGLDSPVLARRVGDDFQLRDVVFL